MNFSGFENGLWDQGVVFGDKEEVEEGGNGEEKRWKCIRQETDRRMRKN